MTAYYNEIDPYCAAWLQNLMDAGHIAPGVIDTRSIEDVRPDELAGYTQCHFFAGIGVWSLALRSAGWPDSRPAWTGSCPCQPFSAAGKGAGFADQRHLWPTWQHLIAQRRPPALFGEQVASKDAEPWIDLVHADLEGMGYAFGCVPFPAAGIGAPHVRDRTYWVAGADHAGLEGWSALRERAAELAAGSSGVAGGLAHTDGSTCNERSSLIRGRFDGGDAISRAGLGGGGMSSRLADADGRNASAERQQCGGEQRQQPQDSGALRLVHERRGPQRVEGACPVSGFWGNADWLRSRDERWRPVEPGTFPLVDGVTNRVGRLRAYGNAINAEAAKAFIESYCEARGLIEQRAAA